jgi:hypothetical protein
LALEKHKKRVALRAKDLINKDIKGRNGEYLRLLTPLDAGATAVVMKAEKRKNGKILGYYAVKCILKTYFDCKDKSLASIRWNCFERERQIMEKLENKFVIKYIEPFTTKNYMIFV